MVINDGDEGNNDYDEDGDGDNNDEDEDGDDGRETGKMTINDGNGDKRYDDHSRSNKIDVRLQKV